MKKLIVIAILIATVIISAQILTSAKQYAAGVRAQQQNRIAVALEAGR